MLSVLLIVRLLLDLCYCVYEIFFRTLHSLINGEEYYGRIRHE
nr:MAG TPA: hypothetical protein [Bacteriophage sp.]